MAWEAPVTKIKELGATMSDGGGRLVNFENFFWGRKGKKPSIFLDRSTEAGGPKGVMPLISCPSQKATNNSGRVETALVWRKDYSD